MGMKKPAALMILLMIDRQLHMTLLLASVEQRYVLKGWSVYGFASLWMIVINDAV